MANINSYPLITPKGADRLVGTETYDINVPGSPKDNPTKNFRVSSIVSTQIPTYIVGTINTMPIFTAANIIGNSIIKQDVAATDIKLDVVSPTLTLGNGLGVAPYYVNFGTIRNSNATSSIKIYGYTTTVNEQQNFNGELHVEARTEMNLITNGVQSIRIKDNGQVDIVTGDLTLPVNKGIYFSGETTAPYELDYYQEATFTPTIGGSWDTNPTALTGRYTRIGDTVTLCVTFVNGAKTGNDGWLEGVPLAPALLSSGTVVSTDGNTYEDQGVVIANTSQELHFTDLAFSSDTNYATITYFVAT